jgi:hypothetical protein
MGRTRFFAALAASLVFAAGTAAADSATTFSAALKSEKLTANAETPAKAFESIRFERRRSGMFSVALLPEDQTLALPEVDLRLLVPRVPKIAKGNADLTKIALIQRELTGTKSITTSPATSISASRTIACARDCGK